MAEVSGEFDEEDFQQFVKDQRDPRWVACLDSVDDQLDRFLSRTLPFFSGAFTGDLHSAAALYFAEEAALEQFTNREAVRAPENRAVAERFEVFLGEVFRRGFDGAWINLPYHDETGMGFCPVVRFPFTNLDIHVRAFLEAAAEERTGAEWLSVWARADKIRTAWNEAGSPQRTQWDQAGWVPPENGHELKESMGMGDEQLSMDLGVNIEESAWAKWVDPSRREAQARKFMSYAGIRSIPDELWSYSDSPEIITEQQSADDAVAELFPDWDAVKSNPDMADAFACFLGECFAKYAGAEWYDSPVGRERSLYDDVNPALVYGFEGSTDHTVWQLFDLMFENRLERDGRMFTVMVDMMGEYQEECRFLPRKRGS